MPVLIHNGHPVYESHEQIVYIDQVLNIFPLIFIVIAIHHYNTGADARWAKIDPKWPRKEESDGEVGQPGGHDDEVIIIIGIINISNE